MNHQCMEGFACGVCIGYIEIKVNVE